MEALSFAEAAIIAAISERQSASQMKKRRQMIRHTQICRRLLSGLPAGILDSE